MVITTQDNGFTRIEACGLTFLLPTVEGSGTDDRVEIREGNERLWIEHGGLLVTQVEQFV